MNIVEKYYNEFYAELAEIDAKGNDFSKIKTILPELSGNETFLDIGSGYGTVTEELIKKGFKVYAVEINKKAIEILRQKGFIVYERDITKPLDIDQKFDIALLLDVLEHVFDPLRLLNETKYLIKKGGYIIVSVPLYFDIIDRIKILLTGSIISLDNLCYGKELYKKFRSYNYDHIRFFRPKEVLELGDILGLELEKIEYFPTTYFGNSKFLKLIIRLFSNKYTVKLRPELLAHNMKVRWRVK